MLQPMADWALLGLLSALSTLSSLCQIEPTLRQMQFEHTFYPLVTKSVETEEAMTY